MPIVIENRQEGAGVIYDCRGALTIRDFYEASQTFLADPEEIKKWRYAIIDLTFAESMDINYQDIEMVVTVNRQLAAAAVPGVLLAVASPNDLGFGLARMWEALVERTGWETRVCRTRPEADAWISSRLQQKCGLNFPDSGSPGSAA